VTARNDAAVTRVIAVIPEDAWQPILLGGQTFECVAKEASTGGFDVQAGGGEHGYRAVRVGDQQFDLGAAEDDTFGAGLDQADDGVAVGLPGLLSDHA